MMVDNNMLEESLQVERRFCEKIGEVLVMEDASNESKVELIALLGGDYFNDRMKMMLKFFQDNRNVQKEFIEEKIKTERSINEAKTTLQKFKKKELAVLKSIARQRTWATSSSVSTETKSTWTTVERYIRHFIELGIVIPVKLAKPMRKRRYEINKVWMDEMQLKDVSAITELEIGSLPEENQNGQ